MHQLTTVRQPFVQMGEVAYQVLADQMEGRDPASVRVELPRRWSFVIPPQSFERPATD
jgi:DNA-binding LacI/PurR family transcriptional regulator